MKSVSTSLALAVGLVACSKGASVRGRCWDAERPAGCVRLVDGDAEPGGDGLTWCGAFDTLREGLASARAAAEEQGACQVWVAEGFYTAYLSSPGDTFVLGPGVEIYGGFAGHELSPDERDPGAHPTIASGRAASGSPLRARHVFTLEGAASLDGMTVSGGLAYDDVDYDQLNRSGGGVFSNGHDLVLRGCVFEDNEAEQKAGAVFVAKASSLRVDDCTFRDNEVLDPKSSSTDGGAVSVVATELVERMGL